MTRQTSIGVLNQKLYPGVDPAGGPIDVLDECVILADFMGIHAVRPEIYLPTIAQYRAAAGVPDVDGKSNGLSLDDSFEAITKLLPDVDVERYLGTWAGFLTKAKTTAAVASVSVLGSALPSRLRHTNLNHRILAYWTGSAWHVLDPLAAPYSRARSITEAELKAAMAAYPTAEAAAAIILRVPA